MYGIDFWFGVMAGSGATALGFLLFHPHWRR